MAIRAPDGANNSAFCHEFLEMLQKRVFWRPRPDYYEFTKRGHQDLLRSDIGGYIGGEGGGGFFPIYYNIT